jgi:ADP-heptose:LPS heptosyltransferase
MPNAKSYPADWWNAVVQNFGDENFIQIGLQGEDRLVSDHRTNLKMIEISKLIDECNIWIGCDSFLQHLARHHSKPGIVVWSKSDPTIFGYPENVNLLADRKYLRKNQFDMWEAETFTPEAFVPPYDVISAIRSMV